jgi:demethylmenaquinone methyltransferase/2-methoxy-6-polyprenyl-1,4-benzoquinol methylase
VCCEAELLPFPDGYFERAMMVDAFHHVRSQPRTAAELVRVLAPGGRLVIEDPHIRYFSTRLLALAEKLLLMRSRILSAEAAAALFAGLPVQAQISLAPGAGAYYLIVDKIKA